MDVTPFDSLEPQKPQFSKLSIAALVISVVGMLMFCAAIVIAFSVGFTNPGASVDQGSSAFTLATVLMCGGTLVNLLGVGLSIGSLFVPQQSKVLSIIGIVLASLVVCSFAALAALGLAMGA